MSRRTTTGCDSRGFDWRRRLAGQAPASPVVTAMLPDVSSASRWQATIEQTQATMRHILPRARTPDPSKVTQPAAAAPRASSAMPHQRAGAQASTQHFLTKGVDAAAFQKHLIGVGFEPRADRHTIARTLDDRAGAEMKLQDESIVSIGARSPSAIELIPPPATPKHKPTMY